MNLHDTLTKHKQHAEAELFRLTIDRLALEHALEHNEAMEVKFRGRIIKLAELLATTPAPVPKLTRWQRVKAYLTRTAAEVGEQHNNIHNQGAQA